VADDGLDVVEVVAQLESIRRDLRDHLALRMRDYLA